LAVIILAAFLTALFCYLGLAKNNLPNGLTFFTGVFAAAIPILLRAAFHRGTRRRNRGDSQITMVAGVPPGGPLPPPTSSSVHQSVPRR
jgi:hypothetical protein